jgi:flagellar biosynthesis protein FlhA
VATVQKAFQNLLRERVSIRDAVNILEALGEAGLITQNTVLLAEYVRPAIRGRLVRLSLEPSGDLSGYGRVKRSAQAAIFEVAAA